MKKLQVLVLSLFFIASGSLAEPVDQLRTLFAIGKWREVLELAPANNDPEVQVMRLESLLQLDEFQAAQALAQDALKQLDQSQRKVMLLHLMKASEKRDDVKSFFEYDRLYLAADGKKSNELTYWRGRMQFLAGKYDLAQTELLQVPLYSDYGFRAQFLLATCELIKGERDFALNRFAKLAAVPTFSTSDVPIAHMAALSQAKLLYDLGKYAEALQSYSRMKLEPNTQLERAWTAMMYGDMLVVAKPTLAAVQYDSAARVAQSLAGVASAKSELDLQRRLLSAELKMRLGKKEESIKAFESVRKDADTLAEGAPENSWLSRQSEMKVVTSQLAELESTDKELQELLQASETKGSKEVGKLKQFSSQLAMLRDDLTKLRKEIISVLLPRWKAHIARLSDSATVGLFSNRFYGSAQTLKQIEALEKAKAAALKGLDVSLNEGAPK